MRRVRYCLALLATIIGCESLPGMKVDNPVVGPPPPRVVAPDVEEQSEPDKPDGPQAGDKVAGSATIEQVSAERETETETAIDINKFPLDPEFPEGMLVATVNSMPITVGDVLEPYKTFLDTKVYPNVPEDRHGEVRKNWVLRFLPEVIDRKLRVSGLTTGLNDKQRKGLNEYLDKSWEDYTVQLRQKMGVSTKQELAERMKEEGADLQRVKQNWREGSIAHQFVLLKIKSTYEPTRQDLLDYYREHRDDQFAYTGRVKWQQIVVRRQKGELRDAAESRAAEILEQLNAGASFSELATKHSEGATRAKGGYWDWTEAGSLACKEEEEFLFSAEVGATSDLIAFRDEFHIVQVLDRVDAGHRSFEQEETQSEIRAALKKADEARLTRKAVEELMKTAVIETVFGDDWKFQHPELEAPRKGSRAS